MELRAARRRASSACSRGSAVFAGGWSATPRTPSARDRAPDGLVVARREEPRSGPRPAARFRHARDDPGAGAERAARRRRRGARDPRRARPLVPRRGRGGRPEPRAAASAPPGSSDVGRERENLRAALAWGARRARRRRDGLRRGGPGAVLDRPRPLSTRAGVAHGAPRALARADRRAARALAVAGGSLGHRGGRRGRASVRAAKVWRSCGPGEDWYRADRLNVLGTMARYRGRLGRGARLYDEALALAAEQATSGGRPRSRGEHRRARRDRGPRMPRP